MLTEAGHDAIHTLDLVDRNRTTDSVISDLADREGRVVVSKDSDFRDGHLLHGTPRRLLEVATGNIDNTDLLALFATPLPTIVSVLDESDRAELTRTALIGHPRRGAGRGGSVSSPRSSGRVDDLADQGTGGD